MQPFAAPVHRAVEQLVSSYLGRSWRATTSRDLAEVASHPAALLSDGAYGVFVKLSMAVNGREQFEIELASLRLLSDRAGIRTPTAIGLARVDGCAMLVMEAVKEVERGPSHWRDLGRTLAHLHTVTWDRCGLENDNYFGQFYQDNTPLPDWQTFFIERRLLPMLHLALASGHLPPALAQDIEHLLPLVPRWCGPAIAPALLHGDANQNNFITTDAGVVVIDPAPYYGHPEYDLALLDFFQPVPPEVFDGYREVRLIDAGFAERRDLWRVPVWLACVADSGPAYLAPLAAAVGHYH